MSALSAANFVSLTDKLTAWWNTGLGTDASGYGLRTAGATAGAYQKAADYRDLLAATIHDPDYNAKLSAGALKFVTDTDAVNVLGNIAGPDALTPLEVFAGQAGLSAVTDIASFATYYNVGAGGAWNALLAPDFASLYYAWKQAYPPNTVCYFEVLQGSTYTNGLGKFVVSGAGAGTFTDGVAIPYNSAGVANFAGGFGQVKWSGATGSGTITVAGVWMKTDGTVASGNGTVSLSGASGTGVLTPPFTNALLLDVTNITIAAGITAGTLYAEAKRPTGRTNPPT
jgi:hypothetical protein